MHSVLPFLVLLVACEGGDAGKETGPVDSGGGSMVDADGDGFAPDVDCNDADPTAHPGADELCDDLDNDCDGLVDESDPDLVGADTWYLDADLDGYGGVQLVTEACDVPEGFVDNQGDCNDLDASIHPGADELCDEADNDCDGQADEDDAIDVSTWYLDSDGDGWGEDSQTTEGCESPVGYVLHGEDCDDADPAYHPGAPEADCTDSSDYNCDGSVGYEDLDGDGFAACEDCDDNDGEVNEDGV